MINHTFAITAYKESPYLEECIKSLLNQTVKSNIIMCSSTPNDKIIDLSNKYSIKLFINDNKTSISSDWNFAVSKCETNFITIAHQDDVYFPDYLKEFIDKTNLNSKEVILYCTDYSELRNGEFVKSNMNLKIKRIGMFLLRFKIFQNSKFIRRRILSIGNMISCPTVTLNKTKFNGDLFKNDFVCDLDWQAWEFLTKVKGKFVYNKNNLMAHRIHKESETTKIINANIRTKEDYEMFCKFWPKSIAKIINSFYKKSEKSNSL